jgi:disulfide bond formation protein DsbB
VHRIEFDFPTFIATANRVASTAAESASVWAIRIALLLMLVVLIAEAQGKWRTHRAWASLWLAGAVLSLCHSLGSIATFHHGSQSDAIESTAQQTEDLLGFRFGAGLFFNYVFVVVWLIDGSCCVFMPERYRQLPRGIKTSITAFLVFIAFNGAIVFQQGWMRWLGMLGVVIWLGAIFDYRSRRGPRPRG